MTPATIVCPSCGQETPVTGQSTVCEGCGSRFYTTGLGGVDSGSQGGARREKAVERDIVRFLGALGFVVSKTSQPQKPVGMTKGLPDLYATHPDWQLTLWIECKRPGGQPTEAQEAWHRTARDAGNLVLVADSVEAVTEYLIEHGAPLEQSA